MSMDEKPAAQGELVTQHVFPFQLGTDVWIGSVGVSRNGPIQFIKSKTRVELDAGIEVVRHAAVKGRPFTRGKFAVFASGGGFGRR